MAQKVRLSLPTKERLALIRSQATDLLWYGRLETTVARAKATARYAEKLITLAMDSYDDTVKVIKNEVDSKGVKIKREVLNDGPKKLTARRKVMSKLYDKQEQRKPKEPKAAFDERIKNINHPLIEKIFNVYGPKYAKRAEELGQRGGYTRVLKIGKRRGDAADMAIVELVD